MKREDVQAIKKLVPNLRVAYTDVDGTMVGPGGSLFRASSGTLTLDAAHALFDAMSAGVDVVIVSGRNRQQLREDARLLGLHTYISELGAEIVYDQGAHILTTIGPFPTEGDRNIYETIEFWGAPAALFKKYPERLEYHTPWSDEPRFYTHMLRGLVNTAEVTDWLHKNGFPDLKLIDSGRIGRRGNLKLDEIHAYHIAPNALDKANAVKTDRHERSIGRNESIALGDSWADMVLAEQVGAFILMKNGLDDDPSLQKAVTDYGNVFVTEKTRGEGWAEALQIFF